MSDFQPFSKQTVLALHTQRRYPPAEQEFNVAKRTMCDTFLLTRLSQAQLDYRRRDGSIPSVSELPEAELEHAVSETMRHSHTMNFDWRLRGSREATCAAVRLDRHFKDAQQAYWRERAEADRVAEVHAQTSVEIDEFVAQRGVELDKAIWALP